jgi:curli production protein
MYTIILLAALGNQLIFDTQQQGDMYTIVPVATLTQDCQCSFKLTAVRAGISGQSNSSQSNSVFIKANQPVKLSRMSFNISPGDNVTITATITDGKDIHLEKQWSPPGKV